MSSIFKFPAWANGLSGKFGPSATETLAAAKTIDADDAMILKLDPAGAGRDVNLPAEGNIGAVGQYYVIINAADAAEDLTVKNDGGDTIGTVSQNEAGIFYNAGLSDAGAESSWTLVFIVTGAIS